MRVWGEKGFVYGKGGVCMHGEREGVYMKGVQFACMGETECVCIWKGLSVHAWGEGGCVHGCIRRGWVYVYERGGVCVHGEKEGVCI